MAGLATVENFSEYENSLLPKVHRDTVEEIDAVLAQPDDPNAEGQQADQQTPPDTQTPDPGTQPETIIVQPPSTQPSADADARIARLEQIIAGFSETREADLATLTDARAQISRLQTELENASTATPAIDLSLLSERDELEKLGLSIEEIDYGGSVYAGVGKIVNAAVAPLKAQQELNKQLAQDILNLKNERYVMQRNQLVPNWFEINGSEAWKKWLKTVDPRTRESRLALATAAHKAMDAEAVAAYVKEFLSENPNWNPQSNKRPVQTTPIEAQITPAQTGAGGSPPAPTKPTYTQKQYEAESARCARLATTDPVAYDKLSKELDAATAEGRITA